VVRQYLQRLKNMNLKNPVLVGFGIRDRQSFEEACEQANGAIIGTAFIKALENSTNEEVSVKQFLKVVTG
jgi:tryptophan synthase alpha chain